MIDIQNLRRDLEAFDDAIEQAIAAPLTQKVTSLMHVAAQLRRTLEGQCMAIQILDEKLTRSIDLAVMHEKAINTLEEEAENG